VNVQVLYRTHDLYSRWVTSGGTEARALQSSELDDLNALLCDVLRSAEERWYEPIPEDPRLRIDSGLVFDVRAPPARHGVRCCLTWGGLRARSRPSPS
jgi:hypothetical protein